MLAIYHAPFREVLVLDADGLPLMSPDLLFQDRAYREHGAHFWPDYWSGRDPQISAVLKVAEPRLQQQTESGQLLIDRSALFLFDNFIHDPKYLGYAYMACQDTSSLTAAVTPAAGIYMRTSWNGSGS